MSRINFKTDSKQFSVLLLKIRDVVESDQGVGDDLTGRADVIAAPVVVDDQRLWRHLWLGAPPRLPGGGGERAGRHGNVPAVAQLFHFFEQVSDLITK